MSKKSIAIVCSLILLVCSFSVPVNAKSSESQELTTSNGIPIVFPSDNSDLDASSKVVARQFISIDHDIFDFRFEKLREGRMVTTVHSDGNKYLKKSYF